MHAGLLLVLVSLALLLPEISQPQSYHAFADSRELLGMANFWDTASNLPFVLVGIAGVYALWRRDSSASVRFRQPSERWAYLAFFAGVLLTGIGSAYYHLDPSDERLVWDRLPIALISGALVLAILGDHRDLRTGNLPAGTHWPSIFDLAATLVVSAATVVYWAFSPGEGGDLAPYLVLQVYALVAVIVILVAGTPRYTRRGDVLIVIGFYCLARVGELFDPQIYAAGHLLSGHTLKHLFAALATAFLLRMILNRSTLAPRAAAQPTVA
jgi:hypothetical protein